MLPFVGTPTAGANGDVTYMVLPGNLQISFTGHNVRHADGRQLQRVGIQPTIRVAPTIRGISEGRDEVLRTSNQISTGESEALMIELTIDEASDLLRQKKISPVELTSACLNRHRATRPYH
jgi:C-terminal processing protease CtpA/Prc